MYWPCLLFNNKKSAWNERFLDLLNSTRVLHRQNDSLEHLKWETCLIVFKKNQNMISDALKEN